MRERRMGRDREREKDKQSKMLICNVRLTAGYIPALLYQRLMTLKTCTELHKMMNNPHLRPQRKSNEDTEDIKRLFRKYFILKSKEIYSTTMILWIAALFS